MNTAAIKDPMQADRYVTRELRLRQAGPHIRLASGITAESVHRQSALHSTQRLAETASRPIRIPEMKVGPQTVVQPGIRTNLSLAEEVPIPKVLIWKQVVPSAKVIVAPPAPERPSAGASPSLHQPNEEQRFADVSLSASGLTVQPQPILPSTTSPLTAPEPDLTQAVQSSNAKPSSDAVSTAVLTLSDLHMPDGTVPLPPINQSAPAVLSGAPDPSMAKDQSVKTNGSDIQTGATKGPGAITAHSEKSGSEFDAAEGFSTQRIVLPKDGQFGVVVVGSSLEEKYPETAELWTGRLAYTVYLRVGQSKNWILQYSLPRSETPPSAGTIARLEAPWPYILVRPDIPPGSINADALMIHGFLNETGRFEGLSLVVPPQSPLGHFVLNALQQWQFRPAMRSRQSTRVEVLLLIPEILE